MYNLWCFVALNYYEISFVGNLRCFAEIFCRDLRTFVLRKIAPKIVSVEKKGQISCMTRSTSRATSHY